jgi:hypothetical protein
MNLLTVSNDTFEFDIGEKIAKRACEIILCNNNALETTALKIQIQYYIFRNRISTDALISILEDPIYLNFP